METSGQLIAVRALMGIGAALTMPATLSIITNIFPREERGKAIGIWAGMAAVGVGLGPLCGGLLLHWFSWSSVFLVNVPVCLAALALGARLVPDSRDPKPGAFDFPGAALSTAGLISLIYAIIEAPAKGWLDPVILAAFSLVVVLTVVFVLWELRTREPLPNLGFFRNPRFTIGSFAIGIASFSLFGSVFGVTQYLQFAHGYSALQAGAAMVPLALGLVLGAGSSAKLTGRLGTATVVVVGLAMISAVLATALLWSPDMPCCPLAVWFFVAAVSIGWVMGPATDSVMGAVPPAKAGVASAMNDVARQVAGALGVAVVGSLIASLYTSSIAEELSTLSDPVRGSAEDSIGAAHIAASALPTEQSAEVIAAAGQAYTDALGIGLTLAATIALLGSIVVRRLMPPRHLPDTPQASAETVTAMVP